MTAIDLHNAPFVLLDDSRPEHKGQPSLLFHNPDHIIRADSFAELETAFNAIDEAVSNGFHVAGWIAYECARHFEPKLAKVITCKPQEALVWMIATKHRKALSASEVSALFHAADRGNARQAVLRRFTPSQSEADYRGALEAVHEYITAGDVYQINHTLPIPVKLQGSATGLYQKLRQRQPVSFGAYIDTGEDKILSLSPELFLEKKGDQLSARPMKGTAPRGRTPEEDSEAKLSLRNDPKSQAENLMIVDLIRNDLSRISEAGSVEVPTLFEVEQYPTLLQMTSTVKAKARASLKPYELLKAMFPCGSVTGAPKVRAMEIIQSLETSPRGVYCGTIGHFSPQTEGADANWCLNVPIRTLILDKNGDGRLNVGSGVVADSDPTGEYEECLLKASFTDGAPVQFSLIETMRYENGKISHLTQHLQRLKNSATYFDFSCDLTHTKNTLFEHIEAIAPTTETRRIRLLVDKRGATSVTSAPVELTEGSGNGTVCLSAVQTNSDDPFLFHKTTNRSLYEQAIADVRKRGHMDVLFFNEYGHLTEGAISNVFVEKKGILYTPPVLAGVLPGILRSELLENRSDVQEKILTESDLKTADNIYIGNALRGLRSVTLSEELWQGTGAGKNSTDSRIT
ncbi:MAG: aminodeoxychorismate synthase component I [Kordiimonas sp.]